MQTDKTDLITKVNRFIITSQTTDASQTLVSCLLDSISRRHSTHATTLERVPDAQNVNFQGIETPPTSE